MARRVQISSGQGCQRFSTSPIDLFYYCCRTLITTLATQKHNSICISHVDKLLCAQEASVVLALYEILKLFYL